MVLTVMLSSARHQGLTLLSGAKTRQRLAPVGVRSVTQRVSVPVCAFLLNQALSTLPVSKVQFQNHRSWERNQSLWPRRW